MAISARARWTWVLLCWWCDVQLGERAVRGAPLSVVVERLGDQGARPVGAAEVICSGEQFQVQVAVTERSYVYIALGRVGQGKPRVIYPAHPEAAPLLVRPGHFQVIPQNEAFALEHPGGAEHLLIMASPTRLRHVEVAQLGAEMLRKVRDPPRPLRERACPARQRRASLVWPARDEDEEIYRVILQRQRLRLRRVRGAWVLRFPLIHR